MGKELRINILAQSNTLSGQETLHMSGNVVSYTMTRPMQFFKGPLGFILKYLCWLPHELKVLFFVFTPQFFLLGKGIIILNNNHCIFIQPHS